MFVLYGLLAIFLLILAFLLVPVRYRVEGTVGENSSVRLRVTWLLHLISLMYSYEKGSLSENKTVIKIAGYTLRKRKPKEKPHSKPKKKLTAKPPENSREPLSELPERMPSAEQLIQETEPSESSPKTVPPPPKEKDAKPKKKRRKQKPILQADQAKSIIERWDTLKAVLTYPDSKIIMRLCLQFAQKELRAIKPTKIKVVGQVGLDDPCHTGLLLGAYEMAAGMWGLRRDIQISGDFTKPVLQLDMAVAGALRIGSLIKPVIWLLVQKPVFRIIIKYLKSDNREDGSDERRKH